MYGLTVLEATSPELTCQQSHTPPESCRGGHLAFLASGDGCPSLALIADTPNTPITAFTITWHLLPASLSPLLWSCGVQVGCYNLIWTWWLPAKTMFPNKIVITGLGFKILKYHLGGHDSTHHIAWVHHVLQVIPFPISTSKNLWYSGITITF